MKKGIKLFRVFGIDISLDLSWFIVFFLFSWSLARGYFPANYPFFSARTYWIMGAMSSLLLFVTVLLHELSHSVVANYNGLNIRGIKLFIFGGVAQLSREPDNARVEFDIAVAGPICSLILHFLLGNIAILLSRISFLGEHNPIVIILSYLAYINLFLALVNLIPAYPLDGGRILRAFLWARSGDLKRSTGIASTMGKLFAGFLMFIGFMHFLKGEFAGLWYVFIGMFLYNAAKMGYEHVLMKDALTDLRVRDVMTGQVVSIDSGCTIDKAVDDYFFRYHHSSFPIMESGSIKGLLTFNRLKEIPREQWFVVTAGSITEPINERLVISPYARISAVLSLLIERELDHMYVMEGGEIIGVVTRRDIMKLLKMKMDLR